MHFTYFFVYIYTELVIIKLYGSLAATVSINQNKTGLIGKSYTSLTCSFTNEERKRIIQVEFFAKNKTGEFDDIKPIAILKLDEPAKLHSSGNYLQGRVTLTNLTSTSTYATLTFHVLNCEDDNYYMCKCYYDDIEGAALPTEKSLSTRISVQASSSKPDCISSVIVSSTKIEMQGFSSSIFNSALNIKRDDMFTIPTSPIDTVTNTHLHSTEILPFMFREGDTVMFICTGNIGNPPGKLIWQKTFPQEQKPITYSNEITYVEKIPSQCLFKGTSNLTVKIYAEDRKANIRCFEESQKNVSGMYIETDPLDVKFQVYHVRISKLPDEKQYSSKTDKITLTCKGNGNPEPQYEWFKKDNNNIILSKKSFYVIGNVKQNKSGVYICEVYNIIDDVSYRMSNSTEINIVNDLPLSQESARRKFIKEHNTAILFGAVGLLVVVIVFFIWYYRKRRQNVMTNN